MRDMQTKINVKKKKQKKTILVNITTPRLLSMKPTSKKIKIISWSDLVNFIIFMIKNHQLKIPNMYIYENTKLKCFTISILNLLTSHTHNLCPHVFTSPNKMKVQNFKCSTTSKQNFKNLQLMNF
jgi:hypothetical protein